MCIVDSVKPFYQNYFCDRVRVITRIPKMRASITLLTKLQLIGVFHTVFNSVAEYVSKIEVQ